MVREKALSEFPGYFIRDDGTVRLPSGKITRGSVQKTGYYTITFEQRPVRVRRVHRLVAAAFVLNPRPDIFNIVDHIDHVRGNNNACNLRWLNTKINCLNRRSPCVHANGSRGWVVRLCRKYYGTYKNYEEALECATALKKQRFARAYAEALASEPPFKECGTQTDETRLQK